MCNKTASIAETPGIHYRATARGGTIKDVYGKETFHQKRCLWGCGLVFAYQAFFKKSAIDRGYITHPDEVRELCATCYEKYNGSITRAKRAWLKRNRPVEQQANLLDYGELSPVGPLVKPPPKKKTRSKINKNLLDDFFV